MVQSIVIEKPHYSRAIPLISQADKADLEAQSNLLLKTFRNSLKILTEYSEETSGNIYSEALSILVTFKDQLKDIATKVTLFANPLEVSEEDFDFQARNPINHMDSQLHSYPIVNLKALDELRERLAKFSASLQSTRYKNNSPEQINDLHSFDLYISRIRARNIIDRVIAPIIKSKDSVLDLCKGRKIYHLDPLELLRLFFLLKANSEHEDDLTDPDISAVGENRSIVLEDEHLIYFIEFSRLLCSYIECPDDYATLMPALDDVLSNMRAAENEMNQVKSPYLTKYEPLLEMRDCLAESFDIA